MKIISKIVQDQLQRESRPRIRYMKYTENEEGKKNL